MVGTLYQPWLTMAKYIVFWYIPTMVDHDWYNVPKCWPWSIIFGTMYQIIEHGQPWLVQCTKMHKCWPWLTMFGTLSTILPKKQCFLMISQKIINSQWRKFSFTEWQWVLLQKEPLHVYHLPSHTLWDTGTVPSWVIIRSWFAQYTAVIWSSNLWEYEHGPKEWWHVCVHLVGNLAAMSDNLVKGVIGGYYLESILISCDQYP